MPSRRRPRKRVSDRILASSVLIWLAAVGCSTFDRVESVPAAPVEREPVEIPPEPVPVPQPEPEGVPETEPIPESPPTMIDGEPDVGDLVFEGEAISPAPMDVIAEEVDPVVPEPEPGSEVFTEPVPVTYDIPMVTNKQVQFWLDYYTKKRPDNFVPGMRRSGKYIERFKEIFREAGIPEDLVYMAQVESAFKVTAFSRARAKGIWQFMSSTARHYDLRVDYWIDERSDPEAAARAATRYLKKLHGDFGDWYLAMAAYNAGEGRVRRGLRRSGARDFWELAKSRQLKKETRHYVPAILAAIQIYKDPAKFGIEYTPDDPIHYETVEVEGAADIAVLARAAGTDAETIRELNPALRRGQTPPGSTTRVNVPEGRAASTLAALAAIPREERVLYARHVVHRGETLSGIADAYGVTVRSIQGTNRLGRSTLIRTGQVLRIPTAGSLRAAVAPTQVASGEPVTHRIRRGDTLYALASRYGTTAEAIADRNQMAVNATLRIGQKLTIVPARSVGAEPGEVIVHRVVRGDTLSGIAQRYGTSARRIADDNGMHVSSLLRIGQRLHVAPGLRSSVSASTVAAVGDGHHTVRSGDSLWSIARLYRTSVDRICSLNSISKHAILYPGTTLRVR